MAHARDVPLVVADHFRLVGRLGLDGVHLGDGSRQVRAVRKALGGDAIVGAYARASRHEGMTAGEVGADYVSFGPVGESGLGDGQVAPLELFEWWSEMIEVPVVAEGGLTPELAGALSGKADFIALGAELWDAGGIRRRRWPGSWRDCGRSRPPGRLRLSWPSDPPRRVACPSPPPGP